MTKWEKAIGLLLACSLVMSLLPVGVLASETEGEPIPDTYPAVTGDCVIDEQNFPDERFRTYVLETWDENEDGVLGVQEADAADQIDVSSLEIASLQGIGYFPALTKLDCSNNLLTSLDLGGMERLQQLRCHGNSLAELNVGQCPALEELYCSQNQLTFLHLGDNPRLTTLLCQDNRLQELDLSGCGELEFLFCFNNCLPYLDVSGTPRLADLQAQGNVRQWPELTDSRQLDLATIPGFDPARATGWKNAVLSGSTLVVDEFTSSVTFTYDLDGEGETAVFTWVVPKPEGIELAEKNFPDDNFRLLVSLAFDTEKDRVLTPDEITAATTLDASGWDIDSLKGIEFFTELETLNCGQNHLPFLDVSGCPLLSELAAEGNTAVMEVRPDRMLDLTAIEGFDPQRASGWTGGALRGTILIADKSADQVRFTYDLDGSLGEKAAVFTWNITAVQPQEPAIDDVNFPDEAFRTYILENLDGNGDGILNEAEAGAVTRLYLEEINISSLEGLCHFPCLRELYCGFNQLTALDLTGCPGLVTVNCDGNGLMDLILPAGLEVLSCEHNRLTDLDIRGCLNLTWLFCSDNEINDLDVSANEKLEKLYYDGGALPVPEESSGEEPPEESVPSETALVEKVQELPQEESRDEIPGAAHDCSLTGHQFAQWSSVILPTCHTEGTLGHSTCLLCGKNFDAGGKELTELAIPMAPDRHGSTENTPAVKSTCTEEGVTAGVFCCDCGRYVSGHTPIPPAHQLSAWQRGTADAQGHFTCQVCGKYFDKSGAELEKNAISDP